MTSLCCTSLAILALCLVLGSADQLVRKKRSLSSSELEALVNSSASRSYFHLQQGTNHSINCSAASVSIIISHIYVAELGVSSVKELLLLNSSYLPFPDNTCRFTNGSTHYSASLTDDFGSCARKFESHEGLLFVNYTVLVVPKPAQGVISRDKTPLIHLSCVYRRELNKTLGSAINPKFARQMIRVASRSGDLNLVLRRLTDTWADESSTNVTVGQRIYFGMDLPVISQRYSLLLQATKCWVTPTETETASTPKYPVITAGVAAPDPTLAGANVVNMNNAERLRASFVSFVWDGQPLSNQLLFLHCRVRVCDNSIANNNCSSPTARRRRSASDIEKKVTLGPFTVENVGSHDVCNKENTMCEHECAVENSGLVVCTCPRGSVLKVDGKGCYKMNPMAETLHVRMIDADRRLDNSVHSISCILGVVTILVTMWVVITHLE